MKKLTVLALVAAVMIVTPAFAVQRNLSPNPTFVFTGASAAPAGTGPATTNNNDSCDIGVTPAATLLLPYFEVETAGAAGTGPTTLFTITNTSRYAQIAHVTLWTNWSAPVLDFNIFLTGYDVQSINLYDVIVRGIVAPQASGAPGTSSTTVPGTSTGIPPTANPALVPAIANPAANNANPNLLAVAFNTTGASGTCVGLPGVLPTFNQQYALQALTTGTPTVTGGTGVCTTAIGGNNGTRAIGYATVDVVASCTQALTTDPEFFRNLLYDNVLIGDYQQIGPSPAGAAGSGFDAAGSEMVHIRAVPEGGLSIAGGGVVVPTNLPFTFYNRYESQQPAATGVVINQDRRQPLPSQWAARWIGGTQTNGGVTVAFNTDYKIWREGLSGPTTCGVTGATGNSALPVSAVRFDEHENAFGTAPSGCTVSPCPPGPTAGTLPETSRVAAGTTAGTAISGTPAANAIFPPLVGATQDVGGWTYMNLANGGSANLTASRPGFNTGIAGATGATIGGTIGAPTFTTPAGTATVTAGIPANATAGAVYPRTTSQNWVIVSMFGNLGAQRLAVDFNAAWLGNGCTPAPVPGSAIGPQPFGEPTGQLVCNPVSTPVCPAGTAIPIPNP